MNGGSTFVLQASGGTVGVVQNVANFSYDANNGIVNLAAIPLDGTHAQRIEHVHVPHLQRGPAPGVQTNWNVASASAITWAGTGDGVNWNNIPNWSGVNASGGTVKCRIPGRRHSTVSRSAA